MNVEELREYALSKENAEECFPFGDDTLVFKVNGKMFMLVGLENNPVQFNVKCDPERAIQLREQYSCVLPGFHMNKRHWNTIIADGTLTNAQLLELIDQSYASVSGKK